GKRCRAEAARGSGARLRHTEFSRAHAGAADGALEATAGRGRGLTDNRERCQASWTLRIRESIEGAFMFRKLRRVLTSAVPALLFLSVLQANSTFIPDSVFKGSNLAGWHVLGQANWQAQKGELVGTVKEGGGWLVLDRSYQDIGVHTYFKCAGGCKTGVLLRAQKTADG